MQYQNLLTTFENGILTVQINRPKALNALNKETFSNLKQLFEKDAYELEGLKGIIITGAGQKSFVAGADISEFSNLGTSDAMSSLSKRGQDIFKLIERFPKIVIAAVNGYALGGGCELAIACHLRVAGARAKFGTPEVTLGIVPGYGATQRLIQLIGKGKAIELMTTADMIGAEEAVQLGLANHAVAQGEEVAKAKEIIEKIAKKAPLAIAKIIELVDDYFDKTVDGFQKEVEAFGYLSVTEDFKEGTSAFMEKRKASFKGK